MSLICIDCEIEKESHEMYCLNRAGGATHQCVMLKCRVICKGCYLTRKAWEQEEQNT